MCELVNGNWTPPVNAGKEVNSPGNEVFPNVSEDGTLYFASDHRPGLGGLDIFMQSPLRQKNVCMKRLKTQELASIAASMILVCFPLKMAAGVI